ncbi:disease resistance protein TAO1-like [Telopea speciosissima]|uniref:disease resistance protein TAO1-like n=1 Tax=Telopea speciosissima TaxID=54955 RepID=UPI001CC578BF|nr:disease resistance protein TAO1-like [Telopea speciosissima]
MLMLLDIESNDRKIVGIHGLGGIGKTTIARAVYNTVFHHFEGCSFIANVRDTAQHYNGLVHLQKQLIFDILKQENQDIATVDDGINVIQQRFCAKKVLIVLDDVDRDIQVTSLVGDRKWFGAGSKIIITSRDRQILRVQEADAIYEPRVMDSYKSLELFSHHAFRRDQPPEDYLDLSEAMVKITGGLPLALQVISSSLYLKEKSVWKGMLKKLQKVPNNDVMQRLKISYDALEDEEQEMFLDTACFFIGMKKDIVCHIWDGCGISFQVGLDALCVRSLVTIGEKGELGMHDLLRDLGRYIVYQENKDEPGKRNRIWSQEDVLDVLDTQTGTSNVKGLSIEFRSISRSPCLMSEGFAAMTRLRLLRVDYAQCSWNFTHSFSELRWLSWKGCPDQYFQTNFRPRKLVVLDLSDSEITENWLGWNYIKMVENLKVLNLTSCCQLSRIPDVSANRLLEVLLLENCENLDEIDTSICCLTNLVKLNMSGCSRLKDLPSEICQLTSLQKLNLQGCKSLKKLPEKLGHLISLTKLDLGWCKNLVDLPSEICKLTSLQKLNLCECESLQKLPEKLGHLISLIELDLGWCKNLVDLPSEICKLTSLQKLNLQLCRSLKKLPEILGHLISLTELDLQWCGNLVDLPSEICKLTFLQKLKLQGCTSLKKLPEKLGCMISLTELDLGWCENLVDLPSEIYKLTSLQKLDLSDCKRLVDLPSEICKLTSVKSFRLISCESLTGLCLPSSLTSLEVEHCSSIRYISGLPSSLTSLDICNCNSMVKLSSTSVGLRNLKTLRLSDCKSLEEIEGVDEKKLMDSLKLFDIVFCRSLKKLPKLTGSKNIRTLRLGWNDVITDFEGGGEGMESLEELGIWFCKSLRKIPYLRDSKRLRILKIEECEELSEIEGLEDYESLQELTINGARSFKTLPKDISFSFSTTLRYFGISRCCYSMERLPDLSTFKELRQLYIGNCGNLFKDYSWELSKEDMELTKIPGLNRLESLQKLGIAGCRGIRGLPDLSNLKNNLNDLMIQGCKNLAEMHGIDRLENLEILVISDCESLERLPDLSNLKKLKRPKIKGCKNLTTQIHGIDRLENLEILVIRYCESLERLPADLSNLKKLKLLKIKGCKNLITQIHGIDRLENLEILVIRYCESLERLPADLSNLKKLKHLKIKGCKNLTEIHGVGGLELLEELNIYGCESLERLPDVSNLKDLRTLIAKDCKKLTEIQANNGLKSLKCLEVRGCISLEKLPDLTKSKELQSLNGVYRLPDIAGIEKLLINGGCTKLQLGLSNLQPTHTL